MPAHPTVPPNRLVLLGALLLATAAPTAWGQADWPWRGRNVHVVVPQRRVFAPTNNTPVQITGVNAGVVVLEQIATTTMDVMLRNPTNRPQEAVVLLPVPDKATVRGFDFQGSAAEPQAKLLRREEARRIYDSIVSSSRDPALLEFVGYNLIQSSVFPVPANGVQKVRLTYEHILPVDGQRIDYVLPRTESLTYDVPWSINVRLTSKRPIATVYSPSHMIETTRPDGRHHDHTVSVRLSNKSTGNPGSFRVSYLVESKDVAASIMAYPDPVNQGGYFLMLVGLPPRPEADAGSPAIKREVTLVLDRSGSMNGPKLKQVKEAALQVIEGLDDGEAFNLVIYNEIVETFAPQPVVKDARTIEAARRFVQSITPRGGTNIHDALLESLRPKPTPGTLPIVLFLTDGLPTIGQTSELAIRRVATKANRHGRRIFTFGVGVDVNTPLLENVAYETRAVSTFVMPKEDVEVK
ncbi:MAG: VIT and VWA domain-containing protein, partial [Phycisphaerae bacterium]|nr:VIT and VWA domain-containing protein [Phycisphaerae bacterium]